MIFIPLWTSQLLLLLLFSSIPFRVNWIYVYKNLINPKQSFESHKVYLFVLKNLFFVEFCVLTSSFMCFSRCLPCMRTKSCDAVVNNDTHIIYRFFSVVIFGMLYKKSTRETTKKSNFILMMKQNRNVESSFVAAVQENNELFDFARMYW